MREEGLSLEEGFVDEWEDFLKHLCIGRHIEGRLKLNNNNNDNSNNKLELCSDKFHTLFVIKVWC